MEQDRNAGNKGDQLKHSLLAEVLQRCGSWPTITYAETHAGAGVYDAAQQENEGSAHIRDLKNEVASIASIDESQAGGKYAALLNEWWNHEGNERFYPGSVVQAAIQLKNRSRTSAEGRATERFEFRVTEACERTHERLSAALRTFRIHPRLGTFQANAEWLTENDHLALLIDPFTYTSNPETLNKGHLDLDTLTGLLERCWSKSTCVVGFWCAMGRKQPDGKENKLRFTAALRELAAAHSASFRWFEYGQYSIAWIGISGGKTVVEGIPGRPEWRRSWLRSIVKESE